jgi:Kef-type K+ transport system membrane component KefB
MRKEGAMLTVHIFLQLIIILLAVQVFGFLGQRFGQPRVIGEILAGLALGPTLLGSVLPQVEATVFPGSALPTLQTLGDIGLVLYMFSLGTHIDTHAMLKHGRKATVVSLSGVLLPLLSFLGYRQKNVDEQEAKDSRESLELKGVGLNEQVGH